MTRQTNIETRNVRLGALDFTVDIAGPADGPPVLCLHGFPQSRRMWRAQLEALAAAGYRAVAHDQRGYSPGARPPDENDYVSEHIIADALELMTALGAPRFHLVGHDWGGQIAWLLAAAHPERVLSLAVLSRPHPAAFARAIAEDPKQAELSRHHRTFRDDATIAALRAANLMPLHDVMTAQGVPAADATVDLDTLRAPGALEAAINWYRANTLTTSALPPVTMPTLYVWGTNDVSVGRHAATLTGEYVRAPYRFEVREDGGHFIVDQSPDEIAHLLVAHFRAYG